ncbi:MAG: DUF4124 domain-containing protein [Methylomonas sp.]
MKNLVFVFALCLSFDSWARVYKCTDASGHTDYQSSPCAEEKKSVQMNPKTGGSVDITAQEQQKALNAEQQKQQELQKEAEEQARTEGIARRKKLAQAESELTQALIKQKPTQFSAYAIPVYDPDQLPDSVKPFEPRLPEIEKFRRLAAQKALATGKCQRVEADELNNMRSKPDSLVILVNCSSGASFYFNETELTQ